MRHIGGVVGMLALGLLHPGCGGTETHRVGLASECRLSSECTAPLLCTAGLCHAACNDERDCDGKPCVDTADGKVCRLPSDSFGPDAGSGGISGDGSGGRASPGGAGGSTGRDASVDSGGATASGGTAGAASGGTGNGGDVGSGGLGTGGANAGGANAGGANAGGVTGNGGTNDSGGSGGAINAAGGSPVDAGPPPPPKSCVGGGAGLDTCGSGTEDCCTSLLVSGAPHFYRSYDGVTTDHKDQTAEASVSSFRLDEFEITIGRYRKFKTAWDTGYRPAASAGKHVHLNGGQGLANAANGGYEPGWDSAWDGMVDVSDGTLGQCPGWSPSGSSETHPMNCVTWYEAYAFCIWDGGFLPSEAEWNFAASGGTDQRVYPWSNPVTSTTIDGTYAVFCGGACTASQNVGSKSKGNGRYGQSDLAGNVWEWTLDASSDPYPTPCADCVLLPANPQYRVYRGGGYQDAANVLYASYRNWYTPGSRNYSLGARCARTP